MKTNEDKMTPAELIGTAVLLTLWALLALAIWS